MKSTDLITFLEEPTRLQELKTAIARPLEEFRRGRSVRGGVSPVELSTQDTSISLYRRHVRQLCKWYLEGSLDLVELEYLASGLDICTDFIPESEEVRDAISCLSSLSEYGNARQTVQEIFNSSSKQ
ncbi:MAG: hypothetical protein ABL983_18955 [Nitrospira sp.]